jgi:hypothetical protein
MVELELATTEQIVDELAKRFTGILFAHVGDVKCREDQEAFCVWFRGGFTLACGLARRALIHMDSKAVDRTEFMPNRDKTDEDESGS